MQQFRRSIVRLAAGLVIGLYGLVLTGCNKQNTATAGKPVGVIDLDQVYKDIGWENEIKADDSAAREEANRQYKAYMATVQNAWTDRRKEIAQAAHLNTDQINVLIATRINVEDFEKLPLSKEQKNQFLSSNNEANNVAGPATQLAQQFLQQRHAIAVDVYREAIKPTIRRVGVAAGVTTVLSSNPNVVFYYDTSVDLSNQVVDEMHKSMPEHSLPPLGRINYPEFHFSQTLPTSAPASGPSSSTQPATDAAH